MVPSSIANQVRRLRADERGAVSVMMGFLMIPLLGSLALGFEVSNWYMTIREMQNAADAAAVAAATNGGANYEVEGKGGGGGVVFFEKAKRTPKGGSCTLPRAARCTGIFL